MRELQLPKHFEPSRVGEVWRVPYEERAREADAAAAFVIARAAERSYREGKTVRLKRRARDGEPSKRRLPKPMGVEQEIGGRG
jgi:hypothetical protein